MVFRTEAVPYDRNPLDGNDRSTLWHAAVNGHTEIVRHLLEKAWDQATIDQEFSKPDKITKRTLLFELAEIGKHEILMDPLLELCPQAVQQNTLQTAVERWNTRALLTLIKGGLGTLAVDEKGSTILHVMARNDRPNNAMHILAQLYLQAGLSLAIGDAEGRTPLHIATLSNSAIAAGKLCDVYANPHVEDKYRETSLSLAIKGGGEWFINRFCSMRGLHQDLISSLQNLQPLPDKMPCPWPNQFSSSSMFSDKPLFLHALERRYASLFVGLMSSFQGWPQKFLRPKEGRDKDVSLKASSIAAQLASLLSRMSIHDRETCKQRIKESGGSRYLDNPPRDYKCSVMELTGYNTFAGTLNVLKLEEGGIEIEDETEAQLVFEPHTDFGTVTGTYSVTIWPDNRILPGTKVSRLFYVLKGPSGAGNFNTTAPFFVNVGGKRIGSGRGQQVDKNLSRDFFGA